MSIKKIQEITGFSYSTISRVLNGKSKEFRISDETRRLIMDAAERVDYRPNILARSLRLQRTYTIGLIVPDIQNPFFGELAWRIERLLRERGYSMMLCNTDEIPANDDLYLQVLVDRQVDGVLLAPIHTEQWRELDHIRNGTSVVLIDRIFYETDLPWVTSDNRTAAEDLTQTLVELGFRRIAYLGGAPDTYINSVRFRGFLDGLKKNGLTQDENLTQFKGYTIRDGEEMMRTLLDRGVDFDAVLCCNNLVFLGAMQAAQQFEVDYKTPGYVQMAAFDIRRYCGMLRRPLICANQDLKLLALNAVSLLIDQIDHRPRKQIHINIPFLVEKHRID